MVSWSSLLRDGYKVKEWMSRLEEDEWPGHEDRSQLSGHSSKDSWEGTNRLASYASLVPFLMWSRGIWSLFLASHHQETIFSRCRRAIGFSSSARITSLSCRREESACQWMRDGMPDHTIEDIYILSGILKGRFFGNREVENPYPCSRGYCSNGWTLLSLEKISCEGEFTLRSDTRAGLIASFHPASSLQDDTMVWRARN